MILKGCAFYPLPDARYSIFLLLLRSKGCASSTRLLAAHRVKASHANASHPTGKHAPFGLLKSLQDKKTRAVCAFWLHIGNSLHRKQKKAPAVCAFWLRIGNQRSTGFYYVSLVNISLKNVNQIKIRSTKFD